MIVEHERTLTMWLSAKCAGCGKTGLLLGRDKSCARCERCIAGSIRGIRPSTIDLLAEAFRTQPVAEEGRGNRA